MSRKKQTRKRQTRKRQTRKRQTRKRQTRKRQTRKRQGKMEGTVYSGPTGHFVFSPSGGQPYRFEGRGFRNLPETDDRGDYELDTSNLVGAPVASSVAPVASSVAPVTSSVAPVTSSPVALAPPPEPNQLERLLESTSRSRSTARSTDMRPAPPIKKKVSEKVSKEEGIKCQRCSKPGSPRFKKAANSKCRGVCSEVIVEGKKIKCQWCKKVKKNTAEICCVGRPPKGNSQGNL